MQDITLISVNWNGKEVMELMLKSYVHHHYSGESLNLILVDNGSDDGSKEWLDENEIPFVSLKENIWHEPAVNLIYNDIKTTYALLADTDLEFLTNIYHYLQWMDERCISVGEVIVGNRLDGGIVRPRIGAWFWLFNHYKMKERGVNTFRDGTDWSYDVGGWYLEKMQQNGFSHHNIERKEGNIDSDVVGMDYTDFHHFGKLSWDLKRHPTREWEITMRMNHVRQRLKSYEHIDLKNKFIKP